MNGKTAKAMRRFYGIKGKTDKEVRRAYRKSKAIWGEIKAGNEAFKNAKGVDMESFGQKMRALYLFVTEGSKRRVEQFRFEKAESLRHKATIAASIRNSTGKNQTEISSVPAPAPKHKRKKA